MTKEEEKYLFWLTSLSGLGLPFVQRFFERYKSIDKARSLSETDIKKAEWMKPREKNYFAKAYKQEGWQHEWEQLAKNHISFYSYFHESYPERLKHIDSPPKRLFVKGKLPDASKLSVAVVGARNCTPYGRDMARMFSYRLAAAGVFVISGMALGIDGWGHQGALEAGGETYAVLGSGVMRCYPSCHQNLYESIVRHGGVISEFPVYARAKPVFFPMRNRIISGLSDGILVVEAREKSGSLITADFALDQGKDVYALPGPVTSALSQGCHRLIRQGAGILITPEELMDEWNLNRMQIGQKNNKNEKMLESPERMVYSCLDLFPKGIDELMKETELSISELMERLITLELKGYAEEVSRNYYIRLL